MPPTAKLSDLTDALEFDSDELTSWLDRQTGRVVVVDESVARAVESPAEEDPEARIARLPDWQQEVVAVARAIRAGDPRYLALPSKFEFHEYRHLERFIGTVANDAHAAELWPAIKGRGAFRCFKATAARLGLLDDWYRYREEALNEFMLEWAAANQIAVDRTAGGPS